MVDQDVPQDAATRAAHGRRPRRDPMVAPAALALALLVVVPLQRGLSLVRSHGVVLMPDLHETLLSAISAQHLRQGTGAWSRIGMYHPGPMWFYWAAPFLAVTADEPSGLVLAALALSATCGAITLAVVWRRCGATAATAAGLVLGLAVVQLSLPGLSFPWNPTIMILAVTAGLVCAAATIEGGSLRLAAVGAWCGAMVAQAHLGALLLGLAIIGACTFGAVRTWRLRRGGRRATLGLAAFALVVAIPWAPVAIDQAVGAHNASAIARYVVTGEVSPRFPPEVQSRDHTFDLSPGAAIVRQAEVTALVRRGAADWGGGNFLAGTRRSPDPWSLLALVGLVGAAAAVARPRTRWPVGVDGVLAWLARASLAALAMESLAAARAASEFRYYLVASSAGVGVALWLVAALGALRWAGNAAWTPLRGQVATSRRTAAAAACVALWGLAALQVAPGPGRFPYRSDRGNPTVVRLMGLAPDRRLSLELDGPGRLPAAQRLVVALVQQGWSVRVDGPFRAHFSDAQRHAPGGPVVLVGAHAPSASSGCTEVGAFRGAVVCLRTAPPTGPGSELAKAIPPHTVAWLDQTARRASGRSLDQGGLRYWSERLVRGTPRVAFTSAIVDTEAWRKRRVAVAYERWLLRAPTAGELRVWQAWLVAHPTSELDLTLGATDEARDAGGTTTAARAKHLADALGLPDEALGHLRRVLADGTPWPTAIRDAYFSLPAAEVRMLALAPRSRYTPSLDSLVAEFRTSADERTPLARALATSA